MDELMEMITWRQQGVHNCRICLYNVEGFWDLVLAWIESAMQRGFVREEVRDWVGEGNPARSVSSGWRKATELDGSTCCAEERCMKMCATNNHRPKSVVGQSHHREYCCRSLRASLLNAICFHRWVQIPFTPDLWYIVVMSQKRDTLRLESGCQHFLEFLFPCFP